VFVVAGDIQSWRQLVANGPSARALAVPGRLGHGRRGWDIRRIP